MLRQIKIVAAIAFVTILLLLQLGCDLLSYAQIVGHQTDAQMIRLFERNEADFNKLIQMAEEDKDLTYVARARSEFSKPARFRVAVRNQQGEVVELHDATEQEVSAERQREYLRLLRKLELRDLGKSEVPEGREIVLTATVRSTSPRDYDMKGYVYMLDGLPTEVHDELESAYTPPMNGHPEPWYRSLKGRWFLYYVNID